MKLQSLKLYDFRNYVAAGVQLHPGVNLIVGENAQGKTNLLEAVFYLSTGRSFRTARNQELIRFGAEFADLGCELFSGGREQSIRAVLFSGRKPRQLYIGGVKQRSATALPGVLTTVLFCPDDLLVLKSGAAGRPKTCKPATNNNAGMSTGASGEKYSVRRRAMACSFSSVFIGFSSSERSVPPAEASRKKSLSFENKRSGRICAAKIQRLYDLLPVFA